MISATKDICNNKCTTMLPYVWLHLCPPSTVQMPSHVNVAFVFLDTISVFPFFSIAVVHFSLGTILLLFSKTKKEKTNLGTNKQAHEFVLPTGVICLLGMADDMTLSIRWHFESRADKTELDVGCCCKRRLSAQPLSKEASESTWNAEERRNKTHSK
ncbi:hypothetical protein V8F20_002130 [Naviculisporaceae sp. PSN 640]